MVEDAVAKNFLGYAVKRLRLSEGEILRCVGRLSEEQMWFRRGEYENSVANLLLHLAGNMRQWILHGIAGQTDVRARDEEFALTPAMIAAEATEQFRATLAEVCGVLSELPVGRLGEVIDPQPTGMSRHPTILEAIFQVVGHVQLHTGQVFVLTKQMLAADLDLSLPRRR